MDAFLIDTPKDLHTCHSIEDFQLQFSNIRDTKVTETKAEHLSATFELPATAVFSIPEEPEKDAQTVEPAQGTPSESPEAAANENVERPMREIRAQDAIMNQPGDDPALQRAVAKHIITSLGTVDGSTWSVRNMSRNASGWTFQYICKNSTAAWMRLNAKNAAKCLVGESSGKDGQDPVNLSRPAFDCRGSITVAFVKNSRKISVKLEHTPMHKTVAELAERFKPAPLPIKPIANVRKVGGSSKKKKPVNGENGEAPKSKKRKKPAGDPTAEGQAPKAKKPRQSRAKKQNVDGQAPPNEQDDVALNLSPTEAARRADDARRKLSESGIDPNDLSKEQFEIFANQSPELQNESLAMLVKYGAARLRIVHPNKENASPANANEGTTDSSGKKKKKSSGKRSLNPDGTPRVKKTRGKCQACTAKKSQCSKKKPECTECVEAGIECYYPPQQRRDQRRKSNQLSDEKAVDEPDDETGEPHAGGLPGDIPGDVPPNLTGAPPVPSAVAMPEAEPEPVPEEEASDLGSPGFNSSHPAPEDMMSHSVGAPTFPEVSHDLYHPGASGLSYPSAVHDEMAAGMDYSSYSSQIAQQQATQSGMTYPHQPAQTSHASYPEPLSAPPPAPEPEPGRVQTPVEIAPPTSSGVNTRRSLPSGSAQNSNGYTSNANTTNGSAWQAANSPAITSQSYAAPVSPRRSRNGRKAAAVNAHAYDTPQNETLAAAATLSQAALQRTQPSPTTRTVSPFQNPTQAAAQAARAKSRQGQRSQSRTTASPFQKTSSAPSATVDTASMYSSGGPSASNTSSNYDQYSRYNTAPTQSGQASSRGSYESYPTSTNPTSSSTPYAGYDSYTARSQSSTSTPLAAPTTQSVSASYTKTAAPTTWSNSTGHRTSNSYGSNNVAASSNSAYNVPAASLHQQSFNVRPQPTAQPSRTNTPASYSAQQQSTQQPRQQQQQQQSYNSYSSQPHSTTSTQQPGQAQQQQQQQGWYGFESSNNNNTASGYGSGLRGAGYGQSAQQRPGAMNNTGSTYRMGHDQELYDWHPGHPPAH